MKISYLLVFLFTLPACHTQNPQTGSETEPTDLTDKSIKSSRDRFLLLDSRVVKNVVNARLEVGTVEKHPANPLFVEDQPWEVRFDNLYGNIVYDRKEELYRCWYSPFIVDHSAKGMTLEQRDAKSYDPPKDREMGICYATSKDGIHWEKPSLGLVEFGGNKENNIVLRGPHGTGIFKDPSESGPAKRYKAFYQGLAVNTSADGLNWAGPTKIEGISVAGDTHNNAFWAPTLRKYVGITRSWGDWGRQVTWIKSDDFINWTGEEVVFKGTMSHQAYAMPVFFHGGVYLGLLAVYAKDSDRVWTELTWSPDTKNWYRISEGTPLIPCSEEKLEYDYGCVYACTGPVFLKDEVRLYYGGSDYLHFGWRNGSLCLATLRPDGFAGYTPDDVDERAVLVTRLVDYPGEDLRVTADIEDGGFLEVKILNEGGTKIAEAVKINSTITDEPLALNKDIPAGRIRIQFVWKKSKIYSFSFE